jgi:hypothetical protein
VLPFSITRHVDLPATPDLAPIADRLVAGLEALGARHVIRTHQGVQFTAGLFRPVKRDNILLAVGSGELTVRPFESGVRITYCLRFAQFLVITGLGMLVVSGFSVNGDRSGSLVRVGVVAALGWLLLFGFYVVRALIEVPRWIRRTTLAPR